MKRELNRRSAIEATIGHMKTDGRLDRNYLLGHAGNAINALLYAAASRRHGVDLWSERPRILDAEVASGGVTDLYWERG